MSTTETPASTPEGAVVTPTPTPAELRQSGGLTQAQRRAAATPEDAQKRRIDFANLPQIQQGFVGLIVLIAKLFGREDLIQKLSEMTNKTPEQMRDHLKTSRDKGLSAEDTARSFTFDPDAQKREQQIQSALNAAPVKFSNTSEFKSGNPNGIVLQRPVADNIRESSAFGHRHHPVNGGRAHHDGIDYAAPNNTPIKAPADAQVLYKGPSQGYGNIIILDHGKGVYTLYGHLDSKDGDLSKVNVGDVVKQGQVFATSGSSGVGTGAHLHYEVLIGRDGKPPINIDPKDVAGKDLSNPQAQQQLIAEAIREAGGVAPVQTRVSALQHAPGATPS